MSSNCNMVFPSRGFVHTIGGRQPGIYKVEGLEFEGVLITGIDLNAEDIIQRQQSINGLRILYTAGPAFGELGIAGEVLLGPSGEGSSSRSSAIINWFNANRVSASDTPVNVSLGQASEKVFLHRLTITQANPELNTQSFFMQGSVATPPSR